MKIISFIHSDLKNSKASKQLSELGDVVYMCDNDCCCSSSENCMAIDGSLYTSSTIKSVLKRAQQHDLVLFLTQIVDVELNDNFIQANSNDPSLITYSNYAIDGVGDVDLINYQRGSIRDGFKFGPLIVLKQPKTLYNLVADADYKFGGLYNLILKVNVTERPKHIAERLYKVYTATIDNRKSGEKQFDYLDVKNRDLQIEFEQIATAHLKEIGAFIDYNGLKEVAFNAPANNIIASVVIPVYNREKTIKDAVLSALNQKTSFPFNVIVVDNHSTDNTTTILNEIAKDYKHLVHIIPAETDLKIGGCWNKALNADECGMFAIQLDSDDIYSSENTVETIVNKFYEEKCAMVIGSYKITNFKLETLPPGVIDHKEWTPTNGMNNAVRINGLGAPRAFYTPLARQILFPNCSYGEDYAMGLAVSRQFKLGRIYDVLYICRRWEGNSDADLTQEKQNNNDIAKDAMRTLEIEKRILLNQI